MTTIAAATVGASALLGGDFLGALGELAVGEDSSETADPSGLIFVASTTSMSAGDRVGVILDEGSTFLSIIAEVIALYSALYLTRPLPGPASVGNLVTDYSVIL